MFRGQWGAGPGPLSFSGPQSSHLIRVDGRVHQKAEQAVHCVQGLLIDESVTSEVLAYCLELVQNNLPGAVLVSPQTPR